MRDLVCLLARGDHARTCARCARAGVQDRALRAVADQALPELSARARDRAIAAGLATAVSAAPRRRRVLVPAGVAVAVAAAAVIAVIAARDGSPPPAPPRPGRIALTPGAPIVVGHARVQLAPTSVAWRTGDGEVTLEAGRVEVEVDPAPHRPFRVVTADFRVDVLGTVFAVELDGVEVRRGAVRVTSTAGAVLVDRLTAGERWSSAPVAGAPEAPAAPAPPEEPAEPEEIAMDPVEVVPPPADATRRAVPHPARSAQAWLGEARSLLAGGDVAGARAAVRQALAARPPRSVRADADALIAESYLRAGDVDTAITHFRGVAERYRDLATGEAALFAAARYEARAGHPDAARRLLETYLQRYPQGSLATQARSQLRSLGPR